MFQLIRLSKIGVEVGEEREGELVLTHILRERVVREAGEKEACHNCTLMILK